MNNNRDPEIQVLLDKQAIYEVMTRYCRGLDRCDAELIESVFHPDAVMDHGDFACSPGEFARIAVQVLGNIGPTLHHLTNIHIDLDGDTAYTESYGLAYQRCDMDGKEIDSFVGARLVERFERRDGKTWKIADRKTILEWNNDIPANEKWAEGVLSKGMPPKAGRKDRSDSSYRRLEPGTLSI